MKFIFLLWFFSGFSEAKVVQYHFSVHTKKVIVNNKATEALAINNQIPAPTIEAQVGDTLQVTFVNKMDEETSIHWHGVLLPNDQDGVPYLTTPPIKSQSSFTYKFLIKHSGTYWYHSHTGLQEQRGLYGALVFHPKRGEQVKADRDEVVVLSDWTHENPDSILANLKKDGDWYALKKNNVISWNRIINHGWEAIKNRLLGSLMRMGPMDISDVAYDAFLVNGKQKSFLKVKPGHSLRLRLINAAASSYFNVEFSGSLMKVVAADGVNVKPFLVKRLKIAIAETYDVIVIAPKRKGAYELRATAEDGSGWGSLFIGKGSEFLAPLVSKPNLFVLHHQHGEKKNQKSMGNKTHHHHGMKKNKKPTEREHKNYFVTEDFVSHMESYKHLRAIKDTNYKKSSRTVSLDLTGSMENYVWTFNNKTLTEADKILIKKGEVLRFVLNNKTMMHHPIHLHGHFFRVLNGQGKRSPLKHTVNVPSMKKVEIEFLASEEKDWFFHCHNLYHMKTGMSRVVSYKDSSTLTPKGKKKLFSDSWYSSNDLSFLSHMTRGVLKVFNTRNEWEIEYEYNYRKDYEVEALYLRKFTTFFSVYAGMLFENRLRKPIIGFRYVLPFLVDMDVRVNKDIKVLIEWESDLQLTERLKIDGMVNTHKEYRVGLSYEFNKNVKAYSLYHSQFKWGLGVSLLF